MMENTCSSHHPIPCLLKRVSVTGYEPWPLTLAHPQLQFLVAVIAAILQRNLPPTPAHTNFE